MDTDCSCNKFHVDCRRDKGSLGFHFGEMKNGIIDIL